MKKRPDLSDIRDSNSTTVRIQSPKGRLLLAGPALAVIAIVALIGLIVVCVRLIEMSERVVVPKTLPMRADVAGQSL